MIFQTFALYPHLTVKENLAYPLREAKVDRKEIERRVAEVAGMLRITHTLGRKPATASGGEQQRIAIGRALIRRPRLLLLDEPLTNLDAKLRHDTRAEFKRLHREFGMTMLYATPDELEALSHGPADRGPPRRPDRPDRHAGPALRRPGRQLRGGQGRLAADEPAAGRERRRRRGRPAAVREVADGPWAASAPGLPGRHAADLRLPAARRPPGRGQRRAARASPPAST